MGITNIGKTGDIWNEKLAFTLITNTHFHKKASLFYAMTKKKLHLDNKTMRLQLD